MMEPTPNPSTLPADSCTRRELFTATLGLASLGTMAGALAQPAAELPSSSRELWQWVRTQPVMDPQRAYLDTASGGPTLRAAMAAEYRAREIQSAGLSSTTADQWAEESTRLAQRYAAFAGCEADEILFTHGAGAALSLVAAGVDLSSGDEILTTTQEHPAALSPWLILARRRGVVVKQIALPQPISGPEQALGLLAGAVTDRTRVLAFSHVQYSDGTALPVQEICRFARQRNILSVVDGAQAFGMLDFNLRDLDCDLYAACFHKWLGGSHGSGLLHVRREILDRLWPVQPRTVDASPPVAFPAPAPGQGAVPAALRRLGNVVPHLWPALRGSEAALDLQQRIGRSRIEARIRELAIYARLRVQQLAGVELLTPPRPGLWAGILTFRIPERAAVELAAQLHRTQRVSVHAIALPAHAEGALRASLNVFNSHDDIDKMMLGLTTRG